MRVIGKRSFVRPSDGFVDNLISSISAIYIAIFSFSALYCYVGFTRYDQIEVEGKLIAFDRLLALRRITASPNFLSTRPAKTKDLPHFFTSALIEQFNEPIGDENESQKQRDQKATPPKSQFDDTLIPSSNVIVDIPMRMAVSGTCDALVTQLSPGTDFHFITMMMVGQVYSVSSDQTKLVNFHSCQPGPDSSFQALIFTLDDGQSAFAISENLETAFLGPRNGRIFTNYPFGETDKITTLLPNALKNYVDLSRENFAVLHARAIDYLILKFANYRLGKHLTPDRLDDAIQQIYEQKEKDASYFGINASSTQFIRIGPFVYFLLSFELWRRVRRLPSGRFSSSKYWFVFETKDILGRMYSFLYAMTPLLLSITIFAVFAISQGLALIVFERVISVQGIFTLTFPRALAPGWYGYDSFAIALLFFIPLQLIVVVLTSMKLRRVVLANLRVRRTSP